MKNQKKIVLLLIAAILFGIPACAEKPAEEPEPEQAVAEPESVEEPEPEPDLRELYPAKEFSEFYFVHEGAKLCPGDAYPESLFEDLQEPEETPDCRTGNMATLYSYEGFTLHTVTPADQENGTTGIPYITTINLEGSSVGTPEGLRVGSTLEDMLTAYGSGYEESYGAYVYSAGISTLSFYFDNQTGLVLYIVYSLDEAHLDAMTVPDTETEPEEASGTTEGTVEESEETDGEAEPVEDYAGITFEGLHTRHFTEFSEDNDYTSGVCAYDEFGNEIPYTYEIYTQLLIERYDLGPILVVFTATDAQGHTARGWQSAFVEKYTEEDEAYIEAAAAECSDDIVEIKNYLRAKLKYQEGYNFPSPVAKSWKMHRANCYGSNRCLLEILELKGYHAIMVWHEENMHYWVMVETEDGWRHIDAISLTTNYKDEEGLMTDEERLTLHPKRPWDTSIFPKAE